MTEVERKTGLENDSDHRRHSVISVYDTSRMNEPVCAYCGELRQCSDHVLPLAVAARIDWSKKDAKRYFPMLIVVACCNECNSFGGATFYRSFNHKRDSIHKKIRKRYAAALRVAEWSESELEELDYALRMRVVHGIKNKHTALQRLRLLNQKHRIMARLAWQQA